MHRAVGIAGGLLAAFVLTSRANLTRAEEPAATPKERPAEITQVWPPQRNGAPLPEAGVRDTDPNCPTGGRMWRWQVVPPRPATDDRRVCRLQVAPTRKAAGAWMDDPSVHLAGELVLAQQTQDGRDFWESDSAQGAWWTSGCARALPTTGFTFGVSVTRKEMEKAEIRRVRFHLAGDARAASSPTEPSATLESIDVWTDPFGDRRAEPLTAPVTSVGLAPTLAGSKVGPPDVGLRGILIVRGSRAHVEVHDTTAAGKPFTVFTSLERDFAGDDPSPSGLRATHAPLPADRHVRVQATCPTLDAAGKGSFGIETPDEKAAVGFSFYVQAGVGPDAAAGLSCALACTIVSSLADYDGDGRPNSKDPAPLDPER